MFIERYGIRQIINKSLFLLLADIHNSHTMDKESRDLEKYLQRTPKKKEAAPSATATPTKRMSETATASASEVEAKQDSSGFQDPVYREISLLNGQINRMGLGELKQACKDRHLDCYGGRDPLKRRLKEHWKVQKLIECGRIEAKANRNPDYLVVIDFEATCEEKNPAGYPHEIIEFPAVLVTTTEAEPIIVDVFHAFVRPVKNPVLSEFCKALTGIEQKVVDEAEPFEAVHKKFIKWLESHGLGITKTYLIITDGPFDMGRFLYLQCKHSNLDYPSYGSFWANLRKVFVNFYKEGFYANQNNNAHHNLKLPGLQTMLSRLGMDFVGQPHSGLDDAKNIARIVVRLLKDQAVIRVNEKIQSVAKGVDDSNRSNGKLYSVVPVSKRESDLWFKAQKRNLHPDQDQQQQQEEE
jgi:3'-5' exoribonuclease 1